MNAFKHSSKVVRDEPQNFKKAKSAALGSNRSKTFEEEED